jgi:antirestriction protein ArdC
MKAQDVYASVTDEIVAALERGDVGNWSAPWHGATAFPRNASTGAAYRGGNVVTLWSEQLQRGYASEWWATYRQWSALGRQVRRGERATFGIKWVDRGHKVDDGAGAELSLRELQRPSAFPVGFSLFHVDQTDAAEHFDGTPWEAPAPRQGPEPLEECAAYFAAIGAQIVPGEPAYSPARDVITLPALEMFDTAAAYYATSAHEHAHWTGHASRLARDLSGKFGSDAYAAEELVAELAAAFVAAHLGISTTPRADHTQYLASWLRVLKADSKALYKAAALAQAAADYLSTAAGRGARAAA